MNILICNQWYGPNSHGGVAQYSEYLARGLSERGHEVVVVASHDGGFSGCGRSDGVDIFRVNMTGIPRWFSRVPCAGRQDRFIRNLIYSKSTCRVLRKLVKDYRIALIEYPEINGEGFFHRAYLAELPYVVRCHTILST